jgi:dipeptide transport system ATP-binding protein
VHAVKGVNFKVEQGKTLAIVGESGCGKSTLARIITMIDPGQRRRHCSSTARRSISPGDLTPEMRRKVQIVFQNPYGSLNPRKKIGDILTEPLIINTNTKAAERRAGDVDAEEGRPAGEHFNRYPHMFSGGQRQRIAIARALMLNPRLLVLDEPVSALDLSVQAQVLNLLADLQDELHLTYVFISHDLSVVRYMADDVMVMYYGEAVEYGSREIRFSAIRSTAIPRHCSRRRRAPMSKPSGPVWPARMRPSRRRPWVSGFGGSCRSEERIAMSGHNTRPHAIIVMGVSGCGKSSVGEADRAGARRRIRRRRCAAPCLQCREDVEGHSAHRRGPHAVARCHRPYHEGGA